jgi:multidrug efflux system membrane fusion protein
MKKLNKYLILAIFVIIFVAVIGAVNFWPKPAFSNAETLSVTSVNREIMADGTVQSNNQATLHFQIGGKMIYLPFKEGDKIYQGQVIAQLDSYALQKQIQIAANTYQTAQNSTDQTQENNQAGVLEGQQRLSLDTSNKQGYAAIPENNVIYDNVKKLVDNSNLAKNSAQLNVDLANYALSLASLTSPVNGIITHLDVNTNNTNITPATSFIVADPNDLVFKANVPETSINYISEGASVKIKINGKETTGTVSKIYPTRIITSTGEGAYVVDVTSPDLTNLKMGQVGTAMINSNLGEQSILVPSWSVLNNKYIWVMDNGVPTLKEVQVGKLFGKQMEIINGLNSSDKIILNPKQVIINKYKII